MPNLDPAAIPATLAVTNISDTPVIAGNVNIPVGVFTVPLDGLAVPFKIQIWNALVRLTANGYLTSTALLYCIEQSCEQSLYGGQTNP